MRAMVLRRQAVTLARVLQALVLGVLLLPTAWAGEASGYLSLTDVDGEARLRRLAVAQVEFDARYRPRLGIEHDDRAYGRDTLVAGGLSLGRTDLGLTAGPGNLFRERFSVSVRQNLPTMNLLGLKHVTSVSAVHKEFAEVRNLGLVVDDEIYGIPGTEFAYVRLGWVLQGSRWMPLGALRLALPVGQGGRLTLGIGAGREVAGRGSLSTREAAIDWLQHVEASGWMAGLSVGRIGSRDTVAARLGYRALY